MVAGGGLQTSQGSNCSMDGSKRFRFVVCNAGGSDVYIRVDVDDGRSSGHMHAVFGRLQAVGGLSVKRFAAAGAELKPVVYIGHCIGSTPALQLLSKVVG